MFALGYAKETGNLTHEQLNKAYGEKGMSFKTFAEAYYYRKNHKEFKNITRLMNYAVDDVLDGGAIVYGSKPFVYGYLVH